MRCLNCHYDGLPSETQLCPHCGAHLPSLLRDVLPVGTTLRSQTYYLNGVLGKGSFGITYYARHAILEDTVAIKEFFPSEYAIRNEADKTLNIPANRREVYERGLCRFLEEGRILAKLHHPNVVQVRDLFEERETVYLVMDLIEGKTLTQVLDASVERKLPPLQVESAIAQLVEALSAIHAAGIYHLDLKPDNILLTSDNKLILVDFGAAKQAFSANRLATRFFTESYAAPEIMAGGEIGQESDLFELGMLLHEMLTGTLPPPAMSRLLDQPNWQPQGLTSPWDRLISLALALKREDRPSTVRQWWEERHHLTNRRYPETAPTLSKIVLPALKRQGMRLRMGRGCIKAVFPVDTALAIVVAAGGAALFDLKNLSALWEIDCPTFCGSLSPDKRLLALVWQREVYLWDVTSRKLIGQFSGHPKPIAGVALSDRGRLVAYGQKDDRVLWWDGFSVQCLHQFQEPMGRLSAVAISRDGKWIATGCRQGTISVWHESADSPFHHLQGHTDSIESLAFSDDGQFLASGGRDRRLSLWQMASGQPLHHLSGQEDWVSAIAWSADNEFVAAGGGIDDKTIRLWYVQDGQEMQHLQGHWNAVKTLAFCPDARYLMSGADDYTVRLWDIAHAAEVGQLKQHSHWVYSVACSGDGRWVAFGNNDTTIRLWDIIQQREVKLLQGHENAVSSVAFSPNSRWLISGSWDGTVRLWDVNTGKLTRIFQSHQNWVKSVAFSPDGKLIASGSWDKTVRLWEVASVWPNLTISKPLRILQGHLDDIQSVAFSPDSLLLATASKDKTLRIWEVGSGQEVQHIEGHKGTIETVAFSPDGQFIVSGSRDKTVRLWHALSGKQLQLFRGHVGHVKSIAFSPDGHFIASAGQDGILRFWDLISGELTVQLQGHINTVNSIAFSADGGFLVSADNDGVVRLWELASNLQ